MWDMMMIKVAEEAKSISLPDTTKSNEKPK